MLYNIKFLKDRLERKHLEVYVVQTHNKKLIYLFTSLIITLMKKFKIHKYKIIMIDVSSGGKYQFVYIRELVIGIFVSVYRWIA